MAKGPVRERILRAAVGLLARGGREAVSTRAVSAAAGVQAPAIYRQSFGDMRGLLDAAAREVLAAYVRHKAKRSSSSHPLEDFRRGWDEHIAFGLANPDAYSILYSGADHSPAAREGLAMLESLLVRVAEAGQLRMHVSDAARLVHAGGKGVVFSLIAAPDPRLAEAMREALLTAITEAAPRPARTTKRVAPRAIALRAVLSEARRTISPGERQLLGELLDRLAAAEE
ncbi:MAG: helix-turn-helix domain-containing protein [Polyangiaceae bacterium]